VARSWTEGRERRPRDDRMNLSRHTSPRTVRQFGIRDRTVDGAMLSLDDDGGIGGPAWAVDFVLVFAVGGVRPYISAGTRVPWIYRESMCTERGVLRKYHSKVFAGSGKPSGLVALLPR
jgi:hypothetical protein